MPVPSYLWKRLVAMLLLFEAYWFQAAYCAEPYVPSVTDPMHEPWRWRVFPELNGLGAHCMTEDSTGGLWFGSVETVWRFDGLNWQSYRMSDLQGSGSLTTLYGAKNEIVFAGGRWGISRYQHGKWTRIFPKKTFGLGEVRKILETPDGDLWAATESGALLLSREKWTLYTTPAVADKLRPNSGDWLKIELLPPSVVESTSKRGAAKRQNLTDVCLGKGGAVWFGTDEGELISVIPAAAGTAERQWRLFNESDGIVCGRKPSILMLQDGRIWVVYESGSVHANVFDGTTWKATSLEEAGGVGDGSSSIQTRDGTIWISGRYLVGALRGSRWTIYQKPEVPIPDTRNFLLEAADGALWMGGPNTELLRIDYETGGWMVLNDLNFGWESPAGDEWFLHRDGRVVVHRKEGWLSYSVVDGVIDAPVSLIGTRSGDVWVAGSHGGEAATARFDGQRWQLKVHEGFAWGIASTSVWEGFDGSVWFGANVDSSGPARHRAGLLQYHDGQWIHHHQPGRGFPGEDDGNPATLLPSTQRPEPIGKFMFVTGLPDGRIWTGRNVLFCRAGGQWSTYVLPNDLRYGIIETMLATEERGLWIGTRQFGALQYDGKTWISHQGKDGLVANSVRSLTRTDDGAIWAATDRGISRFDGQRWTRSLLPPEMNIPHEGGYLRAGRGLKLWVNHSSVDWGRRAWAKRTPVDLSKQPFVAYGHNFAGAPPETAISSGQLEVDSSGNLSILWTGSAPWRNATDVRLEFSHRLDGATWSAFTEERGKAFFSLPSGVHRLEVRARDREFNVDPTPAVLNFVVKPPVWQQPWFLLLTLGLLGAAILQTVRIYRERERLKHLNTELATEVEARKNTEGSLRASEADLRETQAIARYGNWSLDTAKGTLVWSDEVRRVFEIDTTRTVSDLPTLIERFHPEDQPEVKRAFAEAEFSGKAFNLECRLLFPDGRIKYVNGRGRPQGDQSGRTRRVVGTIQDTTERKMAELHISSLNRTYAVLSDINQLIVRERDPNRIFEGVAQIAATKGGFGFVWVGRFNPAAGTMHVAAHSGDAVRLLTATLTQLARLPQVPGGEFGLEVIRDVFNDIATEFPNREIQNAALDAGLRSAVTLPLVTDGQFAGSINLFSHEKGFFDDAELRLLDELALDIGYSLEGCIHEAERKQAVEELKASEERFRDLAETIEDVFWIANLDRSQFFYVSPAFNSVWGKTCQELAEATRLWTESMYTADRDRVIAEIKASHGKAYFEVEYRIKRTDGTTRWIRDRGFPARHLQAKELRILGVARDITTEREMENQFRQVQKMEAVGQLAGGVAHDFNNILAAILIQSELAAESAENNPELQEYLTEIRTAAERAAKLTRQLLLFSRRQVMQTRRVELNDIVTSVCKMLQRLIGENIELRLRTSDIPLYTLADSGMLDQVLLNLAVNARDAMTEGGRLTIETGGSRIDAATARLHAGAEEGPYVWVAVEDTGCGIPAEVMPHIFEPFFTTKEPGKGTGLGLATVFGIVKQHKGWLKVESTVNKGTRFEVYFRESEVETLETKPDVSSKGATGTESILLVEDDEDVRKATQSLLAKQGYQVVSATSGPDAGKAWEERHGAFDLLITDVVMPGGISGYQLAKSLCGLKPSLKVLLTSGYNPEAASQRTKAESNTPFLSKPFTWEQLQVAVRNCLEKTVEPSRPGTGDS